MSRFTILRSRFQIALIPCIAGLCLILLSGGCNTDQPVQADGDGGGTSIPRLSFHKPDSFEAAVDRLSVLATAIQSDEPLPEPLEFKVLEVIHGTGAGAHSHFYLADEERHDDHGHEHEESSEKTHDVEVDVFKEFKDIVKWLPEIAGDGDMEESAWNQVKEISTAFGDVLESADTEDMRNALNSERDAINQLIGQLKDLI